MLTPRDLLAEQSYNVVADLKGTEFPLEDARDYFDYHHTAADTFDKVRIDEVRRVVHVITALVFALAQQD